MPLPNLLGGLMEDMQEQAEKVHEVIRAEMDPATEAQLLRLADMPPNDNEQHALDPPERWCLGDDPCICEQIWLARKDERAAAVQRVGALATARAGRVTGGYLIDFASVVAAIRGES